MYEEYLPDLSEYSEAWVQSANFCMRKKELENRFEELVAQVYIDCMGLPEFEINKKPPAVSFIKETYAKVGHTPEIMAEMGLIKAELAAVEGGIKRTAGIIKVQEMKLSLYQTVSANSRNITGF